MSEDTCGRPDCPGPARCEVEGCEAPHPNACGAELPHWRCPAHEWPTGHEWIENPYVEGHFCSTAWCWRCGTPVTGPLGGKMTKEPIYYEYRSPGSVETIRCPSNDDGDGPPCVAVLK